jgi:nitrite reductase (NADH) small subunit
MTEICEAPALTGTGTLTATRWTAVCEYDDLQPERGVCALIAGSQVAIFRTYDGELYALASHDPFSGANVLAWGIVGCRGGMPTVASPMYKQVFDLTTGRCLDDPTVSVRTFRIRRNGSRVEVAES